MPKNTSKSKADSENKAQDRTHDGQGHGFARMPGPGPKDAGKGAGGRQAIDRLEGEARVRADGGAASATRPTRRARRP